LDASKGERPAIYLTNSLTGWEPPTGPKATLPLFPELEEERDQAEHVKRDVKILVVLGNPPYNAFAGTSPEEEQGLVEPYKEGLVKTWGIKKFNLDDLYVRFFRIAERKIVQTGQGVFSYISNHSYLSDISFVAARERLLKEFDAIWIDCMNGDSRETGKLTPTGLPDPSVFSTDYNKAGIRVGTAVSLFVRRGERAEKPYVRYRDFWGVSKREDLLKSLNTKDPGAQYKVTDPRPYNKFSFRPGEVTGSYLVWPTLPDLAEVHPINGLMEKRGGSLIDIEQNALASRMKIYFNPELDWTSYKTIGGGLASNAARFDAKKTREKVLAKSKFEETRVRRYLVRPFDVQWCYYSEIRPLWNEPRPSLWHHHQIPNNFLMSRMAKPGDPEGSPFFFTNLLSDDHALRTDAYFFPIWFRRNDGPLLGLRVHANLSKKSKYYLNSLGLADADGDPTAAEKIWLHALAIGFSPRYLTENKNGLAIDWPRIPLPDSRNALDASVKLGHRLATLLNTESDVPNVTTGDIAEPYRILGTISALDLRVNAGWGRADTKGNVYPGSGKFMIRDWTKAESDQLTRGFAAAKIDCMRGLELLGRPVDVFLNESTCWRAVPEQVWEFYIGAYQVIKKWLSYREEPLLGRALTKEEAREVTGIVRRLAAIVLMTDELDANYIAVRDHTHVWQTDMQEGPSLG